MTSKKSTNSPHGLLTATVVDGLVYGEGNAEVISGEQPEYTIKTIVLTGNLISIPSC